MQLAVHTREWVRGDVRPLLNELEERQNEQTTNRSRIERYYRRAAETSGCHSARQRRRRRCTGEIGLSAQAIRSLLGRLTREPLPSSTSDRSYLHPAPAGRVHGSSSSAAGIVLPCTTVAAVQPRALVQLHHYVEFTCIRRSWTHGALFRGRYRAAHGDLMDLFQDEPLSRSALHETVTSLAWTIPTWASAALACRISRRR